MTRIPLGQVGSLTTCTSGVLRYPLSNRPLRGGAIFLDRDGVINRRRLDHVKSWEEFEFLPGVLVAMAALKRSGWEITSRFQFCWQNWKIMLIYRHDGVERC